MLSRRYAQTFEERLQPTEGIDVRDRAVPGTVLVDEEILDLNLVQRQLDGNPVVTGNEDLYEPH